MAKIFISYNKDDRDWAQWIAVTLRDNGHEPFVHEWEIGAGQNIPHWMNEKLKSADYLLGVFTDAYTKAIYSGAERDAAFWEDPDGRDGFLLPVEAETVTDWPPLVKPLRRLSLVGLNEADAERALLDFLQPPKAPDKRPPFPGRSRPYIERGDVMQEGDGRLQGKAFIDRSEVLPVNRPRFPSQEARNSIPDPLDRNAFQAWLKTKPPEWSAVLAVRAALRALPLIAQGDMYKGGSNLLPIFRAAAMARFVSAHPTRTSKVASMIASAANALPVAFAATSSADAGKRAADGSNAVRHAANAANSHLVAHAIAAAAVDAIEAGARANGQYAVSLIQSEAQDLMAGLLPQHLARAPLWQYFRGTITMSWFQYRPDEYWQVWNEWYDNVLTPPSPPRSEAWEKAFTDLPGFLPWDEGPEAVNIAIKDRLAQLEINSGSVQATLDPLELDAAGAVGWSRASDRATVEGDNSPDTIYPPEVRYTPPVPEQSPAPIMVEERGGKVARVLDRDSSLSATERDFNAWREPVIDHIRKLTSGDFREGTNHSRARERLIALGSLLPGDIAEVKEQQFRIGYEIERFGGLIVAYRAGGEDMPALNAAVLEDLDRLRIFLRMGIDKLERWAEFRRLASDDPLREADASPEAVGDALEQMTEEMERQPNYFDPGLPASFRFIAEAVKDPVGATKTVIYGAVKSVENLISFLGQRALGIGKNALEAVEKHISSAVARSLLVGLSGAALLLSGALPHAWAWLKPLLEALGKAAGG